ncbi:hypothetical protein Btru_028597 [Bulinus truncatus]|nr:hypothetical protein Btru_028597 [Bulinus truncatus]
MVDMERLVNQHQRSMKQLEKNLQKINATQRLSQAKLDRQKRELSLDLSKLQKTTRGLNDMPTGTLQISRLMYDTIESLSWSGVYCAFVIKRVHGAESTFKYFN